MLADIVDSSPTFVGPPLAVPADLGGRLNRRRPSPKTADQLALSRSADLVGTRSMSFTRAPMTASCTASASGSANGQRHLVNNEHAERRYEVLAYMPGRCSAHPQAHLEPRLSPNPQYGTRLLRRRRRPAPATCTTATAQLAHLAGGRPGAGGAGIYALDVTNPHQLSARAMPRRWSSASGLPSNNTCANVANCGNNLGNTSARRRSAASTTASGASSSATATAAPAAMPASTSC